MTLLLIAMGIHLIFVLWFLICFGAIIKGAIPKKMPENGTVVVLGAKVKHGMPGIHLTARIEAAAKFLKEHPDFKCVGSGGQGYGEAIPEGEVIKIKLMELGIADSRIAIDSEAMNTRDNLANSIDIIKHNGWSENLVIATDAFHQYRANSYAKKLGARSVPLNAKIIIHTLIINIPRETGAITRMWLFRK